MNIDCKLDRPWKLNKITFREKFFELAGSFLVHHLITWRKIALPKKITLEGLLLWNAIELILMSVSNLKKKVWWYHKILLECSGLIEMRRLSRPNTWPQWYHLMKFLKASQLLSTSFLYFRQNKSELIWNDIFWTKYFWWNAEFCESINIRRFVSLTKNSSQARYLIRQRRLTMKLRNKMSLPSVRLGWMLLS